LIDCHSIKVSLVVNSVQQLQKFAWYTLKLLGLRPASDRGQQVFCVPQIPDLLWEKHIVHDSIHFPVQFNTSVSATYPRGQVALERHCEEPAQGMFSERYAESLG
jgi:hypothetical protein